MPDCLSPASSTTPPSPTKPRSENPRRSDNAIQRYIDAYLKTPLRNHLAQYNPPCNDLLRNRPPSRGDAAANLNLDNYSAKSFLDIVLNVYLRVYVLLYIVVIIVLLLVF